jgi:hypothetical protein
MDQKITDLIYRIDNLVPKDVCQLLTTFYEKYEYLAMTETSYKFKDKKNKRDNFRCINLSKLTNEDFIKHPFYKNGYEGDIPIEEFNKIFSIARQYISIMITNYVVHIQKNISPTFTNLFINQTDNIRILKYNKGDYIGDHTDVGPSIRASCTLNLNEDYEGGEFRFFDGKVKHKFKTGDAMLFPAEPIWIHGTEPVTKGTRYAVNCFLKNDNIR